MIGQLHLARYNLVSFNIMDRLSNPAWIYWSIQQFLSKSTLYLGLTFISKVHNNTLVISSLLVPNNDFFYYINY